MSRRKVFIPRTPLDLLEGPYGRAERALDRDREKRMEKQRRRVKAGRGTSIGTYGLRGDKEEYFKYGAGGRKNPPGTKLKQLKNFTGTVTRLPNGQVIVLGIQR